VNNIKRDRTAHILVYINYLAIVLLACVIYTFKFDLFSLGGSLMLSSIIYMLIYLRRVIKPLALELSAAALMVTGLVVFNFLSRWEISGNNIDMTYLTISYICLYFFMATSSAILVLPFKKIDSVSETEHPIYRKIMQTLKMPMYVFGLVFAMLSGLMVYFILEHEPNAALSYPLLKITYVAILWLVIALLVIFIYLSKIKDNDIRKIFLEEKLNIVNYDIKKVKNYFKIFFSLLILLGSIIEMQRGMWVMWMETIMLLGLMASIVWKIYKHTFYNG
jgi:hypothetical protein